jgi:phenylpropionate dioxygenase-like ring-hydroxylating dioxygenase large terminal subunit
MNDATIPAAIGPKSREVSFHRSWFPVGLASELTGDAVIGVDFLGTRVVMYRDHAGNPVVQNAWCPHLGADLSIGQLVEGQLRCAYHHWLFDAHGRCVDIPTGDKIPPGARIRTYPTAEAWGLIWAFNGETPMFELPTIPGTTETDLVFETNLRGVRPVANWVSLTNAVDFQHLRTLHNLPLAATPETIEVGEYGIEFRVETPVSLQHGRITGTSAFGQHLRRENRDSFMLFTGAPIDQSRSRMFYIVGVRRMPESADPNGSTTTAQLVAVREFVERLLSEDEPVIKTMRFKRGILVGADRHLSRFLKYIDEFPRASEMED